MSRVIRTCALKGLLCLFATFPLWTLPLWSNAADAVAAELPDESRLLQAMRQGGVAVLIRHAATEPGVGDPPGFELTDCATQRNLSNAGRAQARRLGEWFKSHGIVPTSVRASPWCRTRETATLAFGRSEDWPPLSNLFGDRSHQGDQARQVRSAIANVGSGSTEVLVSHGVSINAFIGVYLSQGEFVVVRPSGADGAGGVEGGRRASMGASVDAPGVDVLGRLLIP